MGKQIFQTDNKSRWNSFKWTIRFIAFFVIMLLATLILTLVIDQNPSIPLKPDYKSAITARI